MSKAFSTTVGICLFGCLTVAYSISPQGPTRARASQKPAGSSLPSVLAEIDRTVRQSFWDPKFKGVNWSAAVERAAGKLSRARSDAERDAAYDELLAELQDSHTFRVPAGRLPDRNWGTTGLRIGQDGSGYAVKGVIPESSAERAGMKLGDRVLAIGEKKFGTERVNLRDLFLNLEGTPGASVKVTWQPAAGKPRTQSLALTPEEPGDTLVWKSARVIRRDGRAYGYARLWGLNADTAFAVVGLLLDRDEVARDNAKLTGWNQIEGFLLDLRANRGGYDPNVLATFLRGQWSAGDYYLTDRIGGRRLFPPAYRKLPSALLVNSATASAAETLTMTFRTHALGTIVGETTAGMATGGAGASRLSDGSTLWLSVGAVEDLRGKSHEGEGLTPDVRVADRPAPAAAAGQEEAIVEAGLRALRSEDGRR